MIARQLSLDEALEAREAGITQLIENSDSEYRDKLWAAIEELAARRVPFDADMARQIAGDPPASCHPNLNGALFQRAQKLGLIRTVGFVKSPRTVGHGNWLRGVDRPVKFTELVRCGRRYAIKGYKPGARQATLYCDPDRAIGGCGMEFAAK